MKLSVSAWSVQKNLFDKKMSLVEFIDLCHKNGVNAVELLDCFFEDEVHIEKIKKYLDEIKMPVSSYSIGNDFVQDEKKRQEQIEYVKRGIDAAVFLGAKILRVFSGSASDDISYEEGMKYIIDCFKACAEYAEEKGVVMALENHGVFAGKSSQVKDIIEAVGSPALRANTDTGNFLLVCESPADAVRNLADYIAFVHFKDFARVDENGHYSAVDGTQYRGMVIGQGEVPLEDITNYLYSSGYKGYLSIEFEGDGDAVEGTIESIKYTRTIIK